MNWMFWGPFLVYPFAERYVGRSIRPKIESLRLHQLLSPSERQKERREALFKIVSYAGQQVPYYRDLFRSISFEPEKLLKDEKHLEAVPYLTKEIIREQGDRLLSEELKTPWLHKRKTGGSTGPSVTIQYAQDDLDWTAAANLFCDDFTGRKKHELEVHVSAEFSDTPSRVDRIYGFVKRLSMNRQNVFISTLSEADLARVAKRLYRLSAGVVQAHPSTMAAVASGLARASSKPLFKRFVSTGETLSTHQLELIETNLKCRVFNRYGSAEFGVVAHSDQSPWRLTVFDSIVYPESLVSDEAPELVLTGLKTKVMPLIRYRTGDSATLLWQDERPYLTNLQGRLHDSVIVGGKRYLSHYVQDVLDRVARHQEFQIIASKEDHSIRKILVVPVAHGEGRAEIEAELARHLNQTIPVELVALNNLRLSGWRAKFKRVILE